MDDVTVRGITIGVSVFIAIVTITVVISYYSIAQQTVRNIGPGTDIALNYNQSMESMLVSANAGNKITGNQVKSILSYFYKDPVTAITVTKYWKIENSNDVYQSTGRDFSDTQTSGVVRPTTLNTKTMSEDAYYQAYNKLMSEIMPNSQFKIGYQRPDGINGTITITEE